MGKKTLIAISVLLYVNYHIVGQGSLFVSIVQPNLDINYQYHDVILDHLSW